MTDTPDLLELKRETCAAFCVERKKTCGDNDHESRLRRITIEDTIDYLARNGYLITSAPEAGIKWKYCPECGHTEYREAHWNKERECMRCGQSWFADVDYSKAVMANLADRRTANPPEAARHVTVQKETIDDMIYVLSQIDPVHYTGCKREIFSVLTALRGLPTPPAPTEPERQRALETFEMLQAFDRQVCDPEMEESMKEGIVGWFFGNKVLLRKLLEAK